MAHDTSPERDDRSPIENSRDENDLLIWGAANIGKEINLNERQVFHLARKRKQGEEEEEEEGEKKLPVERVGGRLCAWRSKLRAIAR
jgi:hypothetical protein